MVIQIGSISTFLQKCGIATYDLYLSEALINLDIGVTVLAEYPFPNDSSIDKDMKTNVPSFNCWRRNETYDRLIKESQNYDLCHIQHQFGLFPNEYNFVKLLQGIKKPLVITMHDVVQPNFQMSNYFNEMIVKSDKIIVHTKTCYDLLLGWNCPKEKTELIPHGTKIIGVPTKSEARKELQLPEDAKIILSWGFIWESKGILDLVKILAEIKKTYPNAIFVHAGGVHPIIEGSSYIRTILKTAIQLNLSPKDLIITQWLPEDKVATWFGAADVIVLNYMRGSASASGAAHRAMSAHRPAIKTDDPCLEEVPGYTVPRFSLNEMCDAILKVLGDESLQQSLVKQAEEAAMEMSWANVARKHKKVYEKLV